MTAAQLSTILRDLRPLGLTIEHLARLWGYRSHNSIRQMIAGKQGVPADKAAWLEAFHRWAEKHPPPQNNR